MNYLEIATKEWEKKASRTLRAFPSPLNRSIPFDVFKKLKRMPSLETWYNPDVPRYVWINPWQEAVNEAMEHNEKILREFNNPQGAG